jgi:hypothetical protein
LNSLFSGIVGVQIREMRVPPVVESGKHPHVILDCDYDLTENEGRQASGPRSPVLDFFVDANFAYSVLTQDNMRQPDVAFCFMSGAMYTQTINVCVGYTDTPSSTQHHYLIIKCLKSLLFFF